MGNWFVIVQSGGKRPRSSWAGAKRHRIEQVFALRHIALFFASLTKHRRKRSLARQTSLSAKLLQLLVSAIVAMDLSSISIGQRYNDQAKGASKRQRRSRSSLEPYEFRRKP